MSKESFGNLFWMIDTDCTISSNYGMCFFKLNFYNNGKVIISSYSSSDKDPLLTEDIQYLSEYLQSKGWKKPQPHIDLVKSNMRVWKFYWETSIIDCDYFKKKDIEEENTQEDE
jgi:hypothetical protein